MSKVSRRPKWPHLAKPGPGLDGEVYSLRQEIAASQEESLGLARLTTNVFVAQGGSDTFGEGTKTRPYQTVARALQDAPQRFAQSGQSFVVNVIPPFVGPGFMLQAPAQMAVSTALDASAHLSSSIVVQAYYDATLTGLADPRFTALAGPLTSSAGTTYVGTAQYTVPTGTLTDAMTGKLVRVFRAGVEVGRGALGFLVIGGSDTVYITTVNPNTGNTIVQWTPQAGDVLYVIDYAVRFNTAVVLGGPGTSSLGAVNTVLGCMDIVAATAGSTFSNGLAIAPTAKPHAPLEVFGGTVLLASVRIATTVAAGSYGSLPGHVSGGMVCTAQPEQLPWLPAAEAALMANAGGSVRGAQFHVNGPAVVSLFGWLLDCDTFATNGGVFTLGNQIHRATSYVGGGGTLAFGNGVGSATLHNFLAVGRPFWNSRNRIAEAVRSISGAMTRGSTTTGQWSMTWDPLGYGAASPCINIFRHSSVPFTLQINVITGGAAHSFPVVQVQKFGSIRVVAGTAVGPGGQTCRAGATDADYGGLPIVEAANLCNITLT